MIDILAIDTPSLGDRSYLATDGTVALVVDAQRDIDRVLQLASERGVRITHVLETHIHNDYVTGGLALAAETGAEYLVNAADPVAFERTPVRDGDEVTVGRMRIAALATPGHTYTHLSYLLSDGDQGTGTAAAATAVFSGGSLLNGTTGRTDLLGAQHADDLARLQFRSVRQLAAGLPDSVSVCPTHGFGSFCSATAAVGGPSTIGDEKRVNSALTTAEDDFVRDLLAGLDAYPAYYAHMGPANLAGPPRPGLAPPRPADGRELRRRIDAGEWVVDLRSAAVFAAGHLRGALNFESGTSMATYLGWLLPWGTPLTLIGSTADEVRQAQLDLCRIGIDQIEAAAAGDPADWAAGEPLPRYVLADFRTLAGHAGHDSIVLVDVRRDSEWAESHLAGAVHIPLHELRGRLGELPGGQVWVHCQAGYRAAIGASILAAAGRDVVAVQDDYSAARLAGLATVGA